MKLEDEIIAVLRVSKRPMSGYRIGQLIEEQWSAQGKRSQFLFWTYPAVVEMGRLYRMLDNLCEQGSIVRGESEYEGRKTFVYQLECPGCRH